VSLFAKGDEAGGTVTDFTPLRTDGRRPNPQAIFGTADSYCYTVRAKPIVGGEPVMLLEHCIDNDLTGLGRSDRAADEVVKWSLTCQVPQGRVDGWVLIEQDAGGEQEDDGFVDDDEAAGVSDQAAGCQLTSAPGLLGAWCTLPLVFFRRVKRKRGA
jgi:hypothetical protein